MDYCLDIQGSITNNSISYYYRPDPDKKTRERIEINIIDGQEIATPQAKAPETPEDNPAYLPLLNPFKS